MCGVGGAYSYFAGDSCWAIDHASSGGDLLLSERDLRSPIALSHVATHAWDVVLSIVGYLRYFSIVQYAKKCARQKSHLIKHEEYMRRWYSELCYYPSVCHSVWPAMKTQNNTCMRARRIPNSNCISCCHALADCMPRIILFAVDQLVDG